MMSWHLRFPLELGPSPSPDGACVKRPAKSQSKLSLVLKKRVSSLMALFAGNGSQVKHDQGSGLRLLTDLGVQPYTVPTTGGPRTCCVQ